MMLILMEELILNIFTRTLNLPSTPRIWVILPMKVQLNLED